MTTELAAVVLTKNEERHIGDCLESLAWAEKRVVFDAYSTDRTVELAQMAGARVKQHPFESFAAQRDAALSAVEARWIFFVDADERATPALAEEVRRVIRYSGDSQREGWWVPRHNYMVGHRMRGGGWYPDYQLRLLRRDRAHYDPAHPVHEIVILDGKEDYLKEHMLHYNYDSLGQFKKKQDRYIDLEAKILKEKGIRAKPWTYVTMPLREFYRRYIALQGYKDGWVGLQLCALMSWYMLVTYVRLHKLYQDKN